MIKRLSLFLAFLLIALMQSGVILAQAGMAINTTGSPANASAMLDVSSTTQGVLLPRMLSSQRTAIASPATGLMVYQTDAPAGFYFYNGTSWTSLSSFTTAGGDLTGSYPNPTIAATSGAGTDVVAAVNAGTAVINPANLGTGSPSSANYLRGDGTWNTPKYVIPMGSTTSQLGLTTTSTGASDSVYFVGLGAAGNQLVNVNGGTYIDPSYTYPVVAVPVPIGGTVNSFSFFFHTSNTMSAFIMFTGTYTFQAQLYYSAPPSATLTAAEQFYPVTGATVSVNLSTITGGLAVSGETFSGTVSGLSFPLSAGSRLIIMVDYNVSTSPFSLQTFSGYVSASVGMQ